MGAMAMAMAESAVPCRLSCPFRLFFLYLKGGVNAFFWALLSTLLCLGQPPLNPLSTLQLQIPGALPSASLPRVLYRRHLK